MSRKHYYISKLIKDRRKELSLTQKELSKTLGFKTDSHLNGIESGKQGLSNLLIKHFAKALDLDWEDFADAKTADFSNNMQNEVLDDL